MSEERRQDVRDRSRTIHVCGCLRCREYPKGRVARQHRALNRLIAASDERTRRLLTGFLARQHGRGGISLLERITGIDRNTIARGKRELRQPFRSSGRIRRPGAGSPRVEKKVPGF